MALARGGIERRKQLIGRIHPRLRQCIEQRRFACVGVTNQRDRNHVVARARTPARAPLLFRLLQPLAQPLYSDADQAAIDLDLFLARAAGFSESSALALQVRPAAHQARRKVLQLRQLDLQLAFAALRALREDVQDERGAIEYPKAERPLQIALLRRR